MRMDLAAAEDWDRVGDALRGLTGEESPHPHAGLAAAAVEWTLGLAQVYSHKRSVAFVKGNSPAFDHVLPWFLKETYNVQTTTWADVDTEEKAVAWLQSLKKDTAFLMMAEDHPVTGALAPAEAIDRLANEQKIFVFRASHSAFLSRPFETRPLSVRIGSVDGTLAISFAGTRLRVPPLFSQRQSWSFADVETRWRARRQDENRDAVLALETAFPDQRWFSPTEAARLFDRAVLVFDDVSGEVLLREVHRRLSDVPLFGTDMDTANLCRWESTRLLKPWWQPAPPEDKLRGLVVFSAALCARKDFAKTLREAYEEIKRASEW